MRFTRIRSCLASLPFLVVVLLAVAACSPAASVAPTAPAGAAAPTTDASASQPAPSPSAVATTSAPVSFTSPIYGYRIVLPAGWQTIPATVRWDGVEASGHEEPTVDQFQGPMYAQFWAYGAPVSMDLAGFVRAQIAANARDHGDTCPAKPEVQEPISIAGGPGVFLAWNCGILINEAITVHGGKAFMLFARDLLIHAATDAADRSTLDALLANVTLPN